MKSLKQLLWAGAAIAVLAACSAEEEYAPNGAIRPGEEAITISSYIPGKRATDKTTFAEGDVIGLYACQTAGTYANSFTANFMDNVAVTKGADDWTYSPMMAWPSDENEHLSFIAFYPRVITNDANALNYPITVKPNINQQVDALWCTIKDTHINDRNGTQLNGNSEAAAFEATSGPLCLQFKHMLSKVMVQIKLANEYPNSNAKLKALSLNKVHDNGDFRIVTSLSSGSWTDVKTLSNDKFILHADTEVPKDITATPQDIATMFMIPQSVVSNKAHFLVTYSYSLPNGTEKEVTETIYLTGYNWTTGRAYNYTINIALDVEMINVASEIVTWDEPVLTPNIGNDIAEAVDLGLSVKWASHDFGAVTEYETGPGFNWYEHHDFDYTDSWGKNWHNPSQEEWQELFDNCEKTSETLNGVYGYRFTAKNGNSIFFPNSTYWTTTTSDERYYYARVSTSTTNYYTVTNQYYSARPVTK